MFRPLRALVVEDSELDAELLLLELARGGYRVTHQRVQTAEGMRSALAESAFDVILSDYSMPSFDAKAGIAIYRESGLDIPFILVSGTIGEETAVEVLKAGAHDFLVKGRMARLVPAVERELREAHVRQERREAMRKVAEGERRLSAMFHQVAVGMLQLGLDGRIVAVNERLCDLLGLSMADVQGGSARDLGEGDALEQIARGTRSLVHEHDWVQPSGKRLRLSSTMTAVVGEDGAPEYAVAIVQDVTDQRLAEEGLRESIRARDEFLSIASHELKTPITALQLQLSSGLALLRRTAQPVEKLGERLEAKLSSASWQVDRLTTLINHLLDVTRITAGRFALVPEPTDLADVVARVIARCQELVRRSRSELWIDTSPVMGVWDPVALESAVTNLLSNALKFGEGKPVHITTTSTTLAARLVVRDHGIGIAPEVQSRIFERFERAVPAQHYGGFGIGLWLARQVVEAHGGAIRVESTAGEGSAFIVELPRALVQKGPD